ncbi:MAG: D-alanine--D-alanine ligase [Proteobacteria bacterium]|nr:D-alanine--D-alanine ligase [Pseudomonadota bacterium]
MIKDKAIALLMGGESAEREISLNSGKAIEQSLKRQGIVPVIADGLSGFKIVTGQQKIDVVFNILHGEDGEDGSLAAWLALESYDFTGCDQLGGVLSWYKGKAKILVSAAGVKTAASQCISNVEELKVFGTGPWIVKPVADGSSVGLFMVEDEKLLKAAVSASLENSKVVMIEAYIAGVECTVGIVDGHVLPVVSIHPEGVLYDYKAKYNSQKTRYCCPAKFDDATTQALKDDAMSVFRALSLKGWARVDFIVDSIGNRWFLEANTTPGMTSNSLLPKAAAVYGWSFDELVMRVLQTAGNGVNNE